MGERWRVKRAFACARGLQRDHLPIAKATLTCVANGGGDPRTGDHGMIDLLRRTICAAAAATLALGIMAPGARADGYPVRQVTLTVPYAAGGPTDVIARILGDHMGRSLGQTFVIDNAAGAGGTIAADKVAMSAPDGYTLLIHHLALLAAPHLYSNLRYDTRGAFKPIGLVNTGPLVIVSRKTMAANSAAELFAWLKANGEKVTAGHAGAGSNSHLCEVLLAQALGTKFTYVAYRGAAPALNDLMAGQIDIICDQSTNSVPQINAGTIKAFAVTSSERNDALPTVPTVAEVGIPEVNFSVWHGLYAPKGTPDDVIQKLNAALAAAVTDPAVQAKFAAVGTVVYPAAQRSVAAHAELFAKEYARLEKLVDTAGIKPGEAK